MSTTSMQTENNIDLTEMMELLRKTRDPGTNVFEVLDIENHEKRLTRFLAWLLNPKAEHDANTAFLKSYLNCFDLSINYETNIDIKYLKKLESSKYGEKEIDLIIETDSQVIGTEIKTTHTENPDKFKEEMNALKEYAEKEGISSVEMLYLPHLETEISDASFTDKIATWDQVLTLLKKHRGELQTPYEIGLFDDFFANIKKNVIKKEISISPESELYLKFKDYLEGIEVDVSPDSYKNDRKRIYNHLWKWFNEDWDGQFSRKEKFDKNMIYVRLYKDNWYLTDKEQRRPDFTLEIQGTENRLSSYNDYGPDGKYRPKEPHFEMTVALNDNTENHERRKRYNDYINEKEQKALENGGFRHVGEWLEDLNSNEPYNKYHMFSKIIEIDLSNRNGL